MSLGWTRSDETIEMVVCSVESMGSDRRGLTAACADAKTTSAMPFFFFVSRRITSSTSPNSEKMVCGTQQLLQQTTCAKDQTREDETLSVRVVPARTAARETGRVRKCRDATAELHSCTAAHLQLVRRVAPRSPDPSGLDCLCLLLVLFCEGINIPHDLISLSRSVSRHIICRRYMTAPTHPQ